MFFAADYPFLDIFWTMLIFFCWVIWIWMVVAILADVFRRDDISGWGKAAWVVFVIILPFLGVLTYLIIHSRDMSERAAERQEIMMRGMRATSGGSEGAAAEIEKAKRLLDNGTLTQAEFDGLKAKALA